MRRLFGFTLFFLTLSMLAGTTGKIVGRVYDAQTKQGLPGVNVIIEGTSMGAATDPDGYFIIMNVPPAKYKVTAQMIGYQSLTIEDVEVISDLTVTLDFPLKPTTVKIKGVTVTAKRPIIRKDVTTSVAIIDAEQMNAIPVNTVQAAVRQSAGIVAGHVRGGRSSEVVYMVDGIEMRDPYLGNFDSHVPQISVQETSVFTGGFGAEYGSAQSGVVNIVTKEAPSTHISLNLRGRTNDAMGVEGLQDVIDKNAKGWKPGDSLNWQAEKYKRLDFLLGVPIVRKMLGMVVSGEIFKTNGLHPHQDDFMRSFDGKITIHPSPSIKMTIHGLYTLEDYLGYSAQWKYNLENLPDYKANTYAVGVNFSHAISPKTYWELKVNRYFTKLDVNVFEDGSFDLNGDGYINSTDSTVTVREVTAFGDTIVHHYASDRNGIDDFADVDHDRNVEIDNLGELGYDWPQLYNYPFVRNQDINGFIISGYYRIAWQQDAHAINTARWDLTSQVTKNHQLKMGLEGKYFEIFRYRADMASGGNIYMTYDKAFPHSFAGYIQDKMEFKDFIVNAGFRYDFFDANAYVPKDPYHPVTDVNVGGEILNPVKSSPSWKISPRIGFSFPITEVDVLHFTYGHYFQIPPMYILYRNKTWDFSGAFPMVGNPDISPEKTVSYEVGVKHAFTDQMRLDVTIYMKDITGLTDTEQIFYTPVNYYTIYGNADYGSARGIEVTFTKRPGGMPDFLTWNVSYTYGIARGKSSSTRQNYDYIWAGYVVPAEEHYLDWDQRHTVSASIGFVSPAGRNLFNIPGLNDVSINFLTNYGSGLPWTPPSRSKVQNINEGRRPYTISTDARITKNFTLGKLKPGLLIDIYNLFDKKNTLSISDAEWYNVYHDPAGRYDDPTRYSARRRMRIGLEIKW
ncbi:TonB-dependent receptor [candidate division WOR-3 bacterium]|nr:TonB-dependent receptor [candidate division WOR-3 bacterium]